MTLHEHANRLCEAGNKGSLRGVHTILDEWHERAYGELRAELEKMTKWRDEAAEDVDTLSAENSDVLAELAVERDKTDELRAELDAERAQNKLLVEKIAKLPMGCSHCAGFGILYSHGPYSVSISTCPHCKGSGKAVVTPPAPPADPDLDRIKQQRRAEDRAVIDRIHAALSDGTCGLTPDAVFKLALKILKEQREKQPEPPEPPTPQERVIDAKLLSELAKAMHPTPFVGEDGLVRAAIDEIKRARKTLFDERAAWVAIVNNLESKSRPPEPPKKAVYEWRGDDLRRNSQFVGGCYLVSPLGSAKYRWFSMSQGPTGISTSSGLAKAAVEAVVRAHYGDAA